MTGSSGRLDLAQVSAKEADRYLRGLEEPKRSARKRRNSLRWPTSLPMRTRWLGPTLLLVLRQRQPWLASRRAWHGLGGVRARDMPRTTGGHGLLRAPSTSRRPLPRGEGRHRLVRGLRRRRQDRGPQWSVARRLQ